MSYDWMTPQEAAAAELAVKDMTTEEKVKFLEDLELKEERHKLKLAKTDPIEFAKRVYPGCKVGPHHRKLDRIFQDVL